ncbi:ankyrin repeat domain-containing protein [Planctomycetota bacterium]
MVLSKGDYPDTIHLAACKGDLYRVKTLIERGTNIDIEDEFNYTPLHWAVAANYRDVTDYLLGKGADLNVRDGHGYTPLMMARDVSMLERLVSKGADIHSNIGQSGLTKLHMVCASSNKDAAEFLIRKGAEINVEASDGATPLFHAAVNGHADIVELLINRGADINLSMHEGATPIAMANRRGQTEVVNILRRHGALETLHGAAASGDEEEVKRLVAQGADLNARNQNGQTPLHLALKHGWGTVFLISQGADVNAKDQAGRTPLMMAAIRGREHLAEVLIVQGADVNAKANKGETALSLAKENGKANIVELLLKHGGKE